MTEMVGVVAPEVSCLVPVLNEEAGIEEMLDRLLGQSFPGMEVILADGGSTDATRRILDEVAARDPRVAWVDNPGRIQGAGLNRALAASRGRFLVRLDGHSFVAPDYVERCVDVLRATGADVVGGRMMPRPGTTPAARGIELAMTRRWGAGPARFHHAGEAGFVETVYLGSFRREALERVGGWSEDVGVNEDFDLNYRIRQTGGRIWYDPTLEVEYQPRQTYRALARQYFRYGRSKDSMLRKRPGSILPRQAAPALLAPAAVGAILGGHRVRWPARVAVASHVAAVAVAAGRERTAPVGTRGRAGVAAGIMHWTWSAGFWAGLVSPFPAATAPASRGPARPAGGSSPAAATPAAAAPPAATGPPARAATTA